MVTAFEMCFVLGKNGVKKCDTGFLCWALFLVKMVMQAEVFDPLGPKVLIDNLY